jgi:hypothetical protein
MRSLSSVLIGIASVLGAVVCLFVAAMTAALGMGPMTPDRREGLRLAAQGWMAGFAGFLGLALVATVCLAWRRRRAPGPPPRPEDQEGNRVDG